jgi:Xaa-Pro aminopeptidase
MPNLARLIVADSEHSADMRYATRFAAPDPFIFLEKNGRTTIVLNDLEIDRGRQQARVDEIVAYSEISERLKQNGAEPQLRDVLVEFLREQKVTHALVPESFPLGLATFLSARGVNVQPKQGFFWERREHKTQAELRMIRRALAITEAGMARAVEVLKSAGIGKDARLRWGGEVLTSERLRAEIDTAILRQGGLPSQTIVAGGNQACDPHERGSGPLRANSLIIVDVFPREPQSGYFGDLTRTFVRGKANEKQRRLWEVVKQGQELALRRIKPRVAGKSVQDEVKILFEKKGYLTAKKRGHWTGFFHGLGHGLGLELHEEPRIARAVFEPGHVFTVEPGLYVPGVGGVRIEDVVTVTKAGKQTLSRFPKQLEL